MLGLQAEDDDANKTVAKKIEPKKEEVPQKFMNEKQFQTLLASDKSTIEKTLQFYDGTPRKGKDGVLAKYVIRENHKKELLEKIK